MNKLVSVIVPVFNREKTIRRCIDSILTQTHGDLELILVDDGSQDGTGLICDHYDRVDSRVRVFHNINHGVSYSRNYGLDHATGEYVIFVDSDDYINTSYIEHLLEKTENGELALVVGSLVVKTEGKEEKYNMNAYCPNGTIYNDYYALQKISGGVWNKLYRRMSIKDNHIRFNEDMSYSEDRVFNIEYYSHLEHYGIASESIYTCDYVPDQDVIHLSFEKTEKAFRSELEKIKKERSFAESKKIQHRDELMSDAISSALGTFCRLKGEGNDYSAFQRRAEEIRNAAGAMKRADTWKRRLVQICYNSGFLYPVYVYYCHKQKQGMC